MQTENRLFDDLARVASGAINTLGGLREEIELRVKERVERFAAEMDLVSREEFDAVKAELALRKSQLGEIRAQIDRERRESRIISVDADRMRAKLQAAANDTGIKMTLAARNAVSEGGADEEGLLEDLAELERDADQEKK